MMFKRIDDPPASDEQVSVQRVGAATKARFEEIALPHLDAVHRMARALTRNQAEAEDLVQEAFVRALRAFDRFELREYGARPWLLRILHNVFYTTRGGRRREPTLLDDVDFDRFTDEQNGVNGDLVSADGLNWDEFDEELKNAVGQLQPEYRTVLLLWSIEGLSYKEIAETCECALGTVMSRLYRARQVLGGLLRDYAREHKLSTERFDL
jgi:RNA polymerase sigma-70 factor (ECF subfamily)